MGLSGFNVVTLVILAAVVAFVFLVLKPFGAGTGGAAGANFAPVFGGGYYQVQHESSGYWMHAHGSSGHWSVSAAPTYQASGAAKKGSDVAATASNTALFFVPITKVARSTLTNTLSDAQADRTYQIIVPQTTALPASERWYLADVGGRLGTVRTAGGGGAPSSMWILQPQGANGANGANAPVYTLQNVATLRKVKNECGLQVLLTSESYDSKLMNFIVAPAQRSVASPFVCQACSWISGIDLSDGEAPNNICYRPFRQLNRDGARSAQAAYWEGRAAIEGIASQYGVSLADVVGCDCRAARGAQELSA